MTKSIFSTQHKKIVEKLKTARIEARLKQEEVANLLGKSQSYISKIEAGQRRIDIIQLKEFARVYKKSIDCFVK